MPTKSIIVNVMILSTLFGLILLYVSCSSNERKLADGKVITELELKTMYGGTPWYPNRDCAPDNPPACPYPWVGCSGGYANCRFCSGAQSWICQDTNSILPDFDGCTVTQGDCNGVPGWCVGEVYDCRGGGPQYPPYPECGLHNVCND
jgi:hypothetical protein